MSTLIFDDKKIELTKNFASIGADVIEIKDLLANNLFTYDPGFTATAACRSSITYIDGNKGVLLYRGYPIEKLANKYTYMDICYLLLNNKLPSADESKSLEAEIVSKADLTSPIWDFLDTLNVDSHPVGNLLSAVSLCAAFNQKQWSLKIAEDRLDSMLCAIGQMPTIVAACIRAKQGLKPLRPKPELGYIKNFLYMCFAKTDFDQTIVDAIDKIFILHADHEQNASTSTVRMAGSTWAPSFAALSAGIAALWGPAHGGANEACIRMLRTIGSVEQADFYVQKAKDKKDPFRLMGFGHRVYKNYDPRALIMKDICHRVISNGQSDYLNLAKKLESIALQDEYFISRKLYPNIDFYSGLTLDAIGFDSSTFTALFALGRTIGWACHWLEMFVDKDFKISRPRQWYCGETERSL